MFRTILLAICVFAFGSSAARAQPADPGPFVKSFAEQALEVFDLTSREEAEKRFAELLDTYFDTPRIARFLAARHWRGLTDDQKEAYFDAFKDFFVAFYLNQFREFRDGRIEILGVDQVDDKNLFVNTKGYAPGADPVTARWRIRRDEGEMKIVDIVIEGVSLSVSQRDQFNSVITSSPKGFDGLIEELRKGAETGEAKEGLVAIGDQ